MMFKFEKSNLAGYYRVYVDGVLLGSCMKETNNRGWRGNIANLNGWSGFGWGPTRKACAENMLRKYEYETKRAVV